MTCIDAQNLITPFIHGQLDMETLEEFLDHVNNCPVCMEELDVYYALLTAMEQLDEDKELSKNYSLDLKNKIKHYEELIRRTKAKKIRKRFYFMFVMISFIMISSISFGKSQVSSVPITKPSFRLNYNGVPDEESPIRRLFVKYDVSLRDYVKERRNHRAELYIACRDYMRKNVYLASVDESSQPVE